METLPAQVTGLDLLRREYGTLSMAVHASSKNFRMTEAGGVPSLWMSDRAALGRWTTREAGTLVALNLLLFCLFCDELRGTRLVGVRKAVSLVIPPKLRPAVRKALKVRLP